MRLITCGLLAKHCIGHLGKALFRLIFLQDRRARLKTLLIVATACLTQRLCLVVSLRGLVLRRSLLSKRLLLDLLVQQCLCNFGLFALV